MNNTFIGPAIEAVSNHSTMETFITVCLIVFVIREIFFALIWDTNTMFNALIKTWLVIGSILGLFFILYRFGFLIRM